MACWGAAVFDDILVVLGLSMFVALAVGSGDLGSIIWIAVRMFLYLGIGAALGMVLIPRLRQKIDGLPISQGLLAFVVVVTLFYTWTAEILGGMAAITGSFLAGLMFARSPMKDRIENGVSALAYSFFVPVFFVNVGLAANARLLTGDSLWLLLGMSAAAIISKVLGSGIGARLADFTNLEALQLGAGISSRGEVGLIVASVGIAEGIINTEIFDVVVGVVIITTLLTPLMLRALFSGNHAAG